MSRIRGYTEVKKVERDDEYVISHMLNATETPTVIIENLKMKNIGTFVARVARMNANEISLRLTRGKWKIYVMVNADEQPPPRRGPYSWPRR